MLHHAYWRGLNDRIFRKIYTLFIPALLTGCFSEDSSNLSNAATSAVDGPGSAYVASSNTVSSITYGSRAINWDNRAHDGYTLDEAVADFGNILYGWQEEKAFNSAGTFRIQLLKNSLSADCGMISKIAVAPGSEYELQFDVKFHSAFDWSRGGKIGFGFSIGDGFSGCNPAWSGDGGTARLMWYNDNDAVYFQPYVYYKDQPETCGDTFGRKFPATGSLVRGHWYTVKLYVKSNTGSQNNGRIRMTIDNTVILDQSIRWTTNDNKRLINAIYFSTFRGGSQAYWQSDTDGYIYFDNLSWTKLAD
ncbi:MAG TPA: hypothetical protein VIM64_16170, partial [Puia sp.]